MGKVRILHDTTIPVDFTINDSSIEAHKPQACFREIWGVSSCIVAIRLGFQPSRFETQLSHVVLPLEGLDISDFSPADPGIFRRTPHLGGACCAWTLRRYFWASARRRQPGIGWMAGWRMTGFYGMKLMKPPEMVISPATMEKSWEYITWEWKWDHFGMTSSFIRKSHLYVSYGWILLVALWLPIWLSSQFILNLVSGWRVQPLFVFNMFWWLFSMLSFSSISSRWTNTN